jgi:transposase
MSTIPTSLTEKQFDEHVGPYLSKSKRGPVCLIPLYKVFNYILHRLHTGCQWAQLPIDPDAKDPEKKR